MMEWRWAPAAALMATAGSAHAVQYYTLDAAQKALFPAASEFRAGTLMLTEAQREAVARASRSRPRDARVLLWEARNAQGGLLGYFLVDEVTGKHDLITYALALSADGHVLGIEVMDYREAYGGQVRDARWRAQFTGKRAQDKLQIDADIVNISGATLSCVHLTEGIRRLLAVHDQVIRAPA